MQQAGAERVAFIALGGGCYLGALSVGAALVTLYETTNKALQTKTWSPKAKLSFTVCPQVEQYSTLTP